jgi:anti-sigma factor RsiW
MIFGYGCVDVRDRLEAFHDGELSIDERIAIQNHLGECGSCSATASELAELGSTLRGLAPAPPSSSRSRRCASRRT